jgi:hypothetical protein
MSTNITNYNLLTINSLTSANNLLSNITVNNSIKIPKSENSTNSNIGNRNAGLLIKDINSTGLGNFYRLHVNSKDNDNPSLYFNNNELIENGNLLGNLENILQYYPLETSNIIVQGGYINFYNGNIPNSNQGSTGVGLRYSNNNTVQFKNFDTGWIDLVDITKHDQFKELIDVDVTTNPLKNNQYITYNSSNQKFVNSNLAIINDINPTLGGDLNIENHSLIFSNTTNRFIYNSDAIPGGTGILDNNMLVLKNNTTISHSANYLEINNNVYDTNPSIIARSSILNNDVGITLQTIGTGNIELNASFGDVYTNSDSLIIGGYVRNSIYRTSTYRTSSIPPGVYSPSTPYTVPLTNDTVLFDFGTSAQAGTYFANIGEGSDGQKLNLVFNNKSSNSISVIADFTTNGIILGTGYGKGLIFDTIGQSSTLIYLGEGINSWQLLNTGSAVF